MVTTPNPLTGTSMDVLSQVFSTSGYNGWTAWTANLFIIGLLVLLGVTFVYMIALAFNVSALKMWAKGEYMQVIVTFLLAFAVMNAAGLIWQLMAHSTQFIYTATNPGGGGAQYDSTGYDPFTYTQAYIQQEFIDCEKTIYKTLYPINLYYKFIGKTYVDTLGVDELGGWSSSLTTGAIDYISGNINNLLLMHYLQLRFLSLIKYVMPLLIQVGLVLRAFPLTRGTGGLMMAIGFGFYVVYPVSLALLTSLQAPPGSTYCTSFTPPPLLTLNDPLCGLDAGTVAQARYNVQASESQTVGLIEKLKNFLPSFYLQAIFFPLVALTVTWTFTREFGELLAGDLREIGHGLIRLV